MLTNNELQQIYNEPYARLHDCHVGCGVPIVMATKYFYPSAYTIYDVGCNNGWLIKDFLDHEYNAYGLDISEAAKQTSVCPSEKITIVDIREELIQPVKPSKFDIAFCLEVLEHVEAESIPNVFQNFKNISNKVIVTPSNCTGIGHVNIKNHSWWVEKFLNNGFTYKHVESLNFHNFIAQERFKPVTERYPQILQGLMIYDT